MGAEAFQQNTAQSGRQNNNCSHANNDDEAVTVTGGRLRGRYVTADGSVRKFSRVYRGEADAAGGSAVTSLIQQNTAQRGQQNNNCMNLDESDLTLTGGRVEGHCTDRDVSLSELAVEKGRGARAGGGSGSGQSATSMVNVLEQNTAQDGRQNNSCGNLNNLELTGSGSRNTNQCAAADRSTNLGSVYR
ncbi:hypothetical protein [Streptomyces sp. NPDC048639]|uniref:hypothetical protein n=1 Tax=Streptomyces sp. NPDC048639 TaxID=3365581 RepID=UPI00372350E5